MGARNYLQTGETLSEDTVQLCLEADAILKGPIGLPEVRNDVGTEIGIDIELALRSKLNLYANISPVSLLKGVRSVLNGIEPGVVD